MSLMHIFVIIQDLNWSHVLSKRNPPHFKPFLSDELDVGNFAEEFTVQDPINSPGQCPAKHANLFRVSA